MAREFKLPDIGEGVHEGEVVKWFVKEGDAVKENDPIVEVMTDKVTVQIPSPVTGKILQLRAKEGEVVKVGNTLVVFGEAGETAPPRPETTRSASAPPPPVMTVAPPAPAPTGDILAAPAVRRLAKELNVNLAAIRGSGPQGRLTEDDVRKAAQAPPRVAAAVPVPAAAVAPTAGEQRIPTHGLRKRIFEKLAKSNATAAHFTYVEEVDMSQLVHLHDHLARQGSRHPRHADHQLARGRHPRGAQDREAACRPRRPDRDSGNDVPVVLLRPPRNRWSRGGGVRPVGPELPRTSRDDFRGYRLVHFGWVASEYSASAKRLRERSCSVGWWTGTRMSWSSERDRAAIRRRSARRSSGSMSSSSSETGSAANA